jgi:hypothetical protein
MVAESNYPCYFKCATLGVANNFRFLLELVAEKDQMRHLE